MCLKTQRCTFCTAFGMIRVVRPKTSQTALLVVWVTKALGAHAPGVLFLGLLPSQKRADHICFLACSPSLEKLFFALWISLANCYVNWLTSFGGDGSTIVDNLYSFWRHRNVDRKAINNLFPRRRLLARLATLARLAISHALAVVRPRLHHGPAPLQCVPSSIGGFHLVLQGMGQRCLCQITRVVGALENPVPER